MSGGFEGSIIPGATQKGNAPAGAVGEYVQATIASGAAVSLTTATPANVASLALPPGDWEVSHEVDFVLGAASATLFQSSGSVVSATLSGQAGNSKVAPGSQPVVPLLTTVLSATYSQHSKSYRVQSAGAETLYLVAQATFSAGTVTAYGTITARRVR